MTPTTTEQSRSHLLAVWNPAYAQDAMELHLRLLQEAARNVRRGYGTDEDVYVWWGKIRSPNRQHPLPHLDRILAIDVELERDDPGPETHRYLTDYQALYVAHVASVSEHLGIGRIERELRENLFGDRIWACVDPTTRSFIAAGEKIWRDHADDAAFDFSPVILEFGKALEVRTNRLLQQALAAAPEHLRRVNHEGRTVDVLDGPPMSLKRLARYLEDSQAVVHWLGDHLVEGGWFSGSLPYVLDAVAELRNPAAHSRTVDRAAAGHWRRQLMGIGCEGEFVKLARVQSQ